MVETIKFMSMQLLYACCDGNFERVKELLLNPDVDPTIYKNNAIQIAAKHNHIEIVEVLLEDPRVDPSADDNLAMTWARDHGHYEIEDMISKHPKVIASFKKN